MRTLKVCALLCLFTAGHARAETTGLQHFQAEICKVLVEEKVEELARSHNLHSKAAATVVADYSKPGTRKLFVIYECRNTDKGVSWNITPDVRN